MNDSTRRFTVVLAAAAILVPAWPVDAGRGRWARHRRCCPTYETIPPCVPAASPQQCVTYAAPRWVQCPKTKIATFSQGGRTFEQWICDSCYRPTATSCSLDSNIQVPRTFDSPVTPQAPCNISPTLCKSDNDCVYVRTNPQGPVDTAPANSTENYGMPSVVDSTTQPVAESGYNIQNSRLMKIWDAAGVVRYARVYNVTRPSMSGPAVVVARLGFEVESCTTTANSSLTTPLGNYLVEVTDATGAGKYRIVLSR